jgi:hypothetical protein
MSIDISNYFSNKTADSKIEIAIENIEKFGIKI